jgi:phage FluMu protein Com
MEVRKYEFYSFIQDILTDKAKINQLLVDYNVYAAEIECPRCKNIGISTILPINLENASYRCWKMVPRNRQRRTKCNFKISARKGTFFDSNLETETILK